MSFSKLQRNWDELGKQDPLWAILTESDRRGGKWSVEEFFRWGEEEIQQLLSRLEAVGLPAPRGRALDFGCGAGRLTQALCRHFRECVGVDVARSMIELAQKFNKHGDRCRYHVNELSTLFLFPDTSFDFIYSNIVLQHIHPKYSSQYLQDFVRVLSPGGILVFQLPATPRVRGRSPEDGAPLADDAFQSKIQANPANLKARPGDSLHLPVTVQNQSSRWWLQAEFREYSISVGSHWLDEESRFLVEDKARWRLPDDVPPGKETSCTLLAHAPLLPGRYILEIDLVQEDVCWFKEKGGTPARVRVEVRDKNQPPPPEPPQIEMHGIPREQVVGLIQDAGGRVVLIEDEFWAKGWHSFRYFVTK